MTAAARKVLEDCRLALQLLEKETDLERWRVHWAAAVALVRAVGHVLKNVDGQDPKLKQIGAEAFKRWKGDDPAHEIFREFVERERNNILKEYRFSHHPQEEVDVAVGWTLQNPQTGERVICAEVYPIGENIYRPMVDGFREGDDARDILSDAITWWERELAAIDCLAAQSRTRRETSARTGRG